MAVVHPPIDNVTYPVDTICHVGGHDGKGYTYYPILIIGAGESGIAMGCRLRQELGFDQFRIFERKSGIGGTWYTNRYPGIACDMYVFHHPPAGRKAYFVFQPCDVLLILFRPEP